MWLELKNISKKYDIPSGQGQTTVLRDVSLQITQGESVSVVGPSGSGKSTLLNIIGALDKPTSGVVTFAGKNLAELDDSALSRIRNQEIGFVFQLHHLLPQCTVFENVLIPTIPLGMERKDEDVQERAKNLLERVGLEKHKDYFPAQLSGGEMQRVAVVRALINKPTLVLADEPTGSLDRESSENLGQLLVKMNKEEKTTLITVTHSIEIARLMEKVYRLQDGMLENYPIE
ncbi:MAG: ATP-binding cassette domain-containing protein [candidate division Zixibacteria bacterium]|nr:ATP-binding cassette domain-containing protein [candidate division Zixibacteria bacterium]